MTQLIEQQNPFSSTTEGSDIRVKKLSHIVADRLRNQIVSGQRKPGESLPPESELLNQFKVSRPILREALRILEVESLIALGRGARTGATVLAPSVERAAAYASMVLVSAGTTVGELHEARVLVEPTIVAQLAAEGSKETVEQLQVLVDKANEEIRAVRYDSAFALFNQFHRALSLGTGNHAMILLFDIVNLLMQKSTNVLLAASDADRAALPQNLLDVTKTYQRLIDLISARKVTEAQKHWKAYMTNGREFFERTGMASRKLVHLEE